MTNKTILGKISEKQGLFSLILFCVFLIFQLYGTFWTFTLAYGIPLPMADFYFIPGDIFPNDKMFWTSAIFGILSLIIVWVIFKKFYVDGIYDEKKSYKQLILLIIGGYAFFLLLNPWYTLQKYPLLFIYQNGTNITNKEIYFYLTARYGFKSDLYKPFETLEDSIEGLEFAMKNNESGLYSSVFYDMEKFGYENVLKKYKDKTFQVYLLDKISHINTTDNEDIDFLFRNIKSLDYLEKNGLDNNIVEIAKYTKTEFEMYQNGEITKKSFFVNINGFRISDFHDKIDDIKGIHQGIFWHDSNLYIFKKNQEGDWELIDKKIKD